MASAAPEDSPASGAPAMGPVAWSISFDPPVKRKSHARRKSLPLEQRGDTNKGDLADQADSSSANPDGGSRRALRRRTTPLEDAAIDTPEGAPSAVFAAELDLNVLVPRNLTTTREDILGRTHFDVPRFLCLSRPQYKRSCGISSLTSVWNYLYSRVGQGSLPPISQEEAMYVLGFRPPFDQIRFGPFTGNVTLFRWFHQLNQHYGVTGKAYFMLKVHGAGRTIGLVGDLAEDAVKHALRSPTTGLIYHCYNHYMVPIGYQDQARAPFDLMRPTLSSSETEMQLFIGDTSRGRNSAIHVKKFADVELDLTCKSPFYFNIRRSEEGVQLRRRVPAEKKVLAASEDSAESPVLPGGQKAKPQTGDTVVAITADAAARGREGPDLNALTRTALMSLVRTGKGSNIHCILGFRSDEAETDLDRFLHGAAGEADVAKEDDGTEPLVDEDDEQDDEDGGSGRPPQAGD